MLSSTSHLLFSFLPHSRAGKRSLKNPERDCSASSREYYRKLHGRSRRGKEHAVTLPFRGGDFARVAGVDDAPFLTDVILLNCSRAGGTGCLNTKAANSSIVTSPLRNTFIFNYSLSGLRRRRLIIRSKRHSTHASNITLIAASTASTASTASRIGWFASAYHKRSNHGR